MTTDADPVHAPLLTVTEYVLAEVTDIDAVVAPPGDHEYEVYPPPTLSVSAAYCPDGQTNVLATVIVGDNDEDVIVITTTLDVSEQLP
jgi:hypothetical protein